MAETATHGVATLAADEFVTASKLYRELGVATTALKTAALSGRVKHTVIRNDTILYSRSDVIKWIKTGERESKNRAGRKPKNLASK